MERQSAHAPSTAAAPNVGASEVSADAQASQVGQSAELLAASGKGQGQAHGPAPGSVPPVVERGETGFRIQDFGVGQADLQGAHRDRLFCLANELNAEAAAVAQRARAGALYEPSPAGGADLTRPMLDAAGNHKRVSDSAADPQDHLRGWNRVESITGSASPEGEGVSNLKLAEARAEQTAKALASLSRGAADGGGWVAWNPDAGQGDLKQPATWPALRHAEVRVRPAIPLQDESKSEPKADTGPVARPDSEGVSTAGLEAVMPRNALGKGLDHFPSGPGGALADVGVEILENAVPSPLGPVWVLKGGLDYYNALNDAHLQDDLVVSCRGFLWGYAAEASGLPRPAFPEGWLPETDAEKDQAQRALWEAAMDAGAREVTPAARTFYRHPTPRDPAGGAKAEELKKVWQKTAKIPGAGRLVIDSDVMDWPGKLRG